MQKKMQNPISFCAPLLEGMEMLVQLVSPIYGNQKKIQYMDSDGKYQMANSFATVLQDAFFEEESIARAAAVVRENPLPEDGVKTAVLVLTAILKRGVQSGCTRADFEAVDKMLAYSADYLSRIANVNEGMLPGNGLYLMTLSKPVQKYAREHDCARAANVLSYAFAQPLLALAETAGADGYAVYERVKSLAPNQFFSLNQVGIARSISTDTPYTDILRMGFDLTDGTIKDICGTDADVPLQTGEHTIELVRSILSSLLNIAVLS